MAKCIKCNSESYSSEICNSCLNNWTEMRSSIFNTLEKKYGKISAINHKTFIKETKRLEKIWRSSKEKFIIELDLLHVV
jgi:hypothetical protein